MPHTVILDVGGARFRVSKSTLSGLDSYFSRLVSDSWSEGVDDEHADSAFIAKSSSADESHFDKNAEKTIFIDRDPLTFPTVLSYLRSLKVYFTADIQTVYLHKLADEADYYQLPDLHALCLAEISNREDALRLLLEAEKRGEIATADQIEIYKSVPCGDVNAFFERGYAFVDTYELPETAACIANSHGTKLATVWRGESCIACGAPMSWEKFVKHTVQLRPVHVIVKRQTSISSQRIHRFSTGGGGYSSSTTAGAGSVYEQSMNVTPLRAGLLATDMFREARQGAQFSVSSLAMSPSSVSGRVCGSGVTLVNTPGQFNLDQSF